MKNLFWILTLVVVALAGCGGGDGGHDDERPVFEAIILSDQPADGDIAFDPVLQRFTITQGADTLFFGIDDQDPHSPEYRAFLDFPLDGAAGGDVVPSSARIVSATLEVFIADVRFAPQIPTLIDLVSYPVSGLREEDFGSAFFQSRAIDLFAEDQGMYVLIDVTVLMQEAQRLGLSDFQVRFRLDPAAEFGLVGIEDLPNVTITAPLLTVLYRL